MSDGGLQWYHSAKSRRHGVGSFAKSLGKERNQSLVMYVRLQKVLIRRGATGFSLSEIQR